MSTATVHPLNPAHVSHRNDFKRFVVDYAEPWHRVHLVRLYGCWDSWNVEHFESAMTPPYILLSVPSCPRSYGDCSPIAGFGGRSQIRLRPSLLTGTHRVIQPDAPVEGCLRFVADVLLHEMIHQWQQEVTGAHEDSYHGHGRTFRDKCNEIGARIGLPRVGLKPRRGVRALPSCNYWPHNVRENNYYLGAIEEQPALVTGIESIPVSGVSHTLKGSAVLSEVEAIANHALLVLRSEQVEELIRLLETRLALRAM